MNRSAKIVILPVGIAYALMVPLFHFNGLGGLDFWWSMSLTAVILISSSFLLDRSYLSEIKKDLQTDLAKKIGLGLLSAAVLFGVFFVGNIVSRWMLPFAGGQIDHVYDLKDQAHSIRIFLLMAFLIGPGEEIFWRGFLQKQLSRASRPFAGFAAAALLYTMIHIASGNFMLIGAAAVCGIVWGWMFKKYNSVVMNVISHTVWDISVFLIFPFTGG